MYPRATSYELSSELRFELVGEFWTLVYEDNEIPLGKEEIGALCDALDGILAGDGDEMVFNFGLSGPAEGDDN